MARGLPGRAWAVAARARAGAARPWGHIEGDLSVSGRGCVMHGDGSDDGDEGAGGDDGIGEARESASEQGIPVTLPHAGPFKIANGQVLLGRPFPAAAGAQVPVAASASWTNRSCHYPCRVTLRETGALGGGLPSCTCPSGGAVHTEHWKIPSAGRYRLEVNVDTLETIWAILDPN